MGGKEKKLVAFAVLSIQVPNTFDSIDIAEASLEGLIKKATQTNQGSRKWKLQHLKILEAS